MVSARSGRRQEAGSAGRNRAAGQAAASGYSPSAGAAWDHPGLGQCRQAGRRLAHLHVLLPTAWSVPARIFAVPLMVSAVSFGGGPAGVLSRLSAMFSYRKMC